jgi:mono/diheme cytochrome c family protein
MSEHARTDSLKRKLGLIGLLAFCSAPCWADDAPNADAATRKHLDVPQLFATTCGWCHSDAGRAAGKGPQLMNTARSDDFIRHRIKNGKEGKMPAFGASFSDADIEDIIAYIRALKPD